jgi:hypothetical protein
MTGLSFFTGGVGEPAGAFVGETSLPRVVASPGKKKHPSQDFLLIFGAIGAETAITPTRADLGTGE